MGCVILKPHIHMCAEWFANHLRTVCEPNARMCAHDCEPALCHLWTVRIPFAENQNLSVFCTNRKRTRCSGCTFHAPGVLCSPQVRRKLINRAPLMRRIRMTQRVSGTLVYTKLYLFNQNIRNFVAPSISRMATTWYKVFSYCFGYCLADLLQSTPYTKFVQIYLKFLWNFQ